MVLFHYSTAPLGWIQLILAHFPLQWFTTSRRVRSSFWVAPSSSLWILFSTTMHRNIVISLDVAFIRRSTGFEVTSHSAIQSI